MAILDPVKLVITNYPENEIEYLDVSNNQENEENSPKNLLYAIGGQSQGCVMTFSEPETIDLSMCYENDLISVNFPNARQAFFDSPAYAEITGVSSDYSISMVSNDGYAPTDWYKIQVESTASEISFEKTEEGYILTSDRLRDLRISANSDNAIAKRSFSTDEYQEILIYEIDEKTIGISVDTDGDGIFETPVENSPETPQFGDINADGEVSADDAAYVLIEAALQGSGADSELTPEQLFTADINGNGVLDASDAAAILQYSSAIGAGHNAFGTTMVLAVFPELYAILALLVLILIAGAL